ncbi:type II toxin-antitoxin system RelE/ParE family toxin [Sphingomonas sp. RB3P16]|uniref:type II toxin-antitoxin system RelE/ParE family toxin n=1 Tax=Parasphingomonas frigoris TaxID=3096163 RepID=UPI002FCC3BE4
MRVVWSLRSLGDLDRIWLFLAQRDIDLAHRTIATIRLRAQRLVAYPQLGRPVGRAYREWSIIEVRYVVTYAISDGQVRIVRVHHARENRETP